VKKYRFEVRADAGDDFGNTLAWKRAGFENAEAVYEHVRSLPLEEKIDLLVELNMRNLAKLCFKRKGKFLRKLGQKTWVDSDEVLDHIKKTYTGTEDTDWVIHDHNFYGYWVDPNELYASRAFGSELTTHRKELTGKEDE